MAGLTSRPHERRTPAVAELVARGPPGTGPQDNAGAIIDPGPLSRARQRDNDPAACLADNDACGFFASVDALMTTKPTRTNVDDFRAILIDRPPAGATP